MIFDFGLRRLPLGIRGERIAARYLRWHGFRILDRNVRLGDFEIDIIAREGDTIAFVEVKTRQGDEVTQPQDSVGPTKQRHIRKAAHRYIAGQTEAGWYYRYDVVAVIVPEHGKAQVTLYRNAFPDE